MATVNKDFKIKHGLIVEGASATVNGNQILTEVDGDAYILDLIGGETLITSVSNEFEVSNGELVLDRTTVDAYYDAAGSADDAEAAAIAHTDARETAITTAYQSYADTAEADAISTASADATSKANAAQSAAEATASADATTKANDAEAAAILAAAGDATTKANAAQSAAEDYADSLAVNYDVFGAAAAAQAAAELHADNAVADLVNGAPELLDTLNELAAALQDNPDVITDLQDIAAGKQNTLTAGSNIDITGDTISVVNLDSADISDFDAQALTATAFAYDVYGSAQNAEDNANAYADGLASNYDPSGAAFQALTDANANTTAVVNALTTDEIEEGVNNLYFTDARAKSAIADALNAQPLSFAPSEHSNIEVYYSTSDGEIRLFAENGVADSTTSDLAEGSNLYFTDDRAVDALEAVVPNFTAVEINSVAKQVAATTTVATASQVTAIQWNSAEYRSAEFLVKTVSGDHSEISKVLLTLDVNNNISITEYGTVGTNGSLMTITATTLPVPPIFEGRVDVQLRVTTLNNASVVLVTGTLLA